MFNKSINSTMQDFKKHLSKKSLLPLNNDQPQEEQKENSLFEKYEQKLAEKRNHRKLLERAQKIAMKQKLKQIVADNVQYFRNILEAKELHKPNQHSLKLPARIVPSQYRTEFPKRKQYDSQNSSVDMKKSFFDRSKNFSQSKLPFTTTYQNEFKKIQDIQKKKYQRSKQFSQIFQKKQFTINAPSFLDTQNNLQYRNWGTGAVMPSMKPSPKVATTDIPFKATSMYRSQFHQVSLPKTKIITHEESFPQNIDLWMNNSSYCNDFNKKKTHGPQNNYKPRQNPGATNLPFKSTTQYKQSFIESIKAQGNEKKNKKSLIKKLSNQDIERLVLQL